MEVMDGEWMQNVCLIGRGISTCSFIGMLEEGTFICAKGTEYESAIRQRIANGSMVAQGDNCSGGPDFEVNDGSNN